MTAQAKGADVIVVGAGLHGCSAALHLAQRGARVIVLEQHYAGRHASGVNAGGVRTLSRDLAEIPLALAALEIWHRIGELVDDDCGFAPHGQYRIAESEADVAQLRTREAQLHARGWTHERWLDADEIRARIPTLAPHVRGALGVDTDGAANPYRTTFAFRRKAQALGVVVREGAAVTGIERVGAHWRVATGSDTVEARNLVNCAGAWGDRVAALVGDTLPVEPIAPMMLVTQPVPHFLDTVVLGTSRPLSFKQMANDTLLIGGGRRARVDRDRVETILDFGELAEGVATLLSLFPWLRSAVINRGWAGIEGRMPDDLPVIGPSPVAEGVVHACGFSAHGFALGPIVGRIVADLVVDERTDLPIEPFAVGRFAPSPDSRIPTTPPAAGIRP